MCGCSTVAAEKTPLHFWRDHSAHSARGNNITQGASLYSTFASVLSGFAFTAIVLLVVTWLGRNDDVRRVLASIGSGLVASFFGLLLMAVGFAAVPTNTLMEPR